MKINQIVTLVGAGILSLAAVMILEHEGPKGSQVDATLDFEDTSSLVEYSLPAPTAEPPAKPEEPSEATPSPEKEERFVSVGGSDPIAASTESEGASGSDEVAVPLPSEPLPDPSVSADVSPQVEGASPLAENTPAIAGLDSTSGEATDSEATGGIGEDFMKAVATATGKESPTTDGAGADGEAPASIIEETPDGFWLRQAKLNDVFQHLAQIANMQFFHNTDLDGPTYVVTGQLMNDDPIKQMEELSLMYGVTIHQKGNTVYALTAPQLSQLPSEPFRYQLKYLRPKDIEQIKLILQPFLTPGSGIIEYESKTNTLIVMDNTRKLDALALFLEQIDQPKQQIAIETRILRVTSDSKNRIGVDWSSVLGDTGTTISSATSLNALFNLPDLETAASFITLDNDGNNLTTSSTAAIGSFRTAGDEGGSGSLVLSPVQLTAVIRALNSGGLANQESSPTLIAEDNEEGLISIIDRIPIVTSTVTITDGSQNITDEVRYKIDEEDPTGDPATTREVGVSVSVTPTILPDNTIRMALRPRSAQVTEYITTPSGNLYPRVNESTVTTTARVPNGHSLLIGGFYEEISSDSTNKVPVLGDIPAVSLLFKSKTTEKKHTSLVFIVTPKLYHPNIVSENDLVSHEIHDSHVLPSSHDYPDPDNPGHNYRSKLRNTLNNSFKRYEPDAPANLLHPEHPYNSPEALPIHGKTYDSEPVFASGASPTVSVRPVGEGRKNGGLLGKMFGGNKKNAQR